MIVKIPGDARRASTRSKQATARGISINATVSFTVPQCLAVAEAVERGLQRREADGHDVSQHGSGVHDHGRPAGRLAEGR